MADKGKKEHTSDRTTSPTRKVELFFPPPARKPQRRTQEDAFRYIYRTLVSLKLLKTTLRPTVPLLERSSEFGTVGLAFSHF